VINGANEEADTKIPQFNELDKDTGAASHHLGLDVTTGSTALKFRPGVQRKYVTMLRCVEPGTPRLSSDDGVV
jgi:hypothetical protein